MRKLFVALRIAASQHHRLLLLGAAGLAVVAAPGCARHTAPKPAARPLAVTKADTPLPDWAPAEPSPEFLRAAHVLREMGSSVRAPLEVPGRQDDLAAKAFWTHYDRTLTLAWELFGTLDDRQVGQLVSTRQVRLPVKSFTEKQRDLLERYFELWRREMRDLPERETEWGKDWLVDLYKGGAREDLSNVLLTFQVRSHSRVAMILYVVKPDGTLSHPFPAGIADLDGRRDGTPSANDGRGAEDRREGESP
jgi:hypothetical protein